jgi:arylsulfatase A-like enzyme
LGQGYNTYAIGKWHLTPAEQISAAGPYNRWPLGRGFERYYGFLSGDTSQYYPDLVQDNRQVEPPNTPEEGYHLTPDLVDKAISFIADSKQLAPDKPFFLYFATGADHAPHQVPKEWADKYKGKFDDGWDAFRERVFARQKELGVIPKNAALSRHDPDVQDWNALSPDERKLYVRMMEVFAGFLEHTDHHIGRLIAFLEQMGELDNTLIMLISDNGASAEGGPHGSVNENKFFNNVPDDLQQNLDALDDLGGPKFFNHYAWGWAFAGDTPFRRWKRETYRGGVSDPFLVHWPQGIKAKGETRTQYAHAIDMVPATAWELYNLADDPTEANNLAATNRGKLIEMIALWYVEAGKYNVLPLDSRGTTRFADPRPQLAKDRNVYVYYPNTQAVPENVAVKVLNRAHTLTAEVEIPKGGAEGILICHGSNEGGYALFVKDNKLHYVHNYVGAEQFHIESIGNIPEGKAMLRYAFRPTGKPDIAEGKGTPGRGQLFINDQLVGHLDLPYTIPLSIGISGGLRVGRNNGSPVSYLYSPPFAFTGTIFKVTADVSTHSRISDDEREAAAKRAMSQQ